MIPVVSFDARWFILSSIFVWGERSVSAQLAVRSPARMLTQSNPGANIESGARSAAKRCLYRVFRSRLPVGVGRRAAAREPDNFDCTE